MKTAGNIFRICAAVLLLALPFTGCQEDELVKPSALLSESSLTFAAEDAEPQMLTIASDADWMIDVAEDWITVDPMVGSQTMQVTVTVADNVTDGVMNTPRQGTITIANDRGYQIKTVVYQKGDNYLGVEEMPVSEVLALEDGKYAKIHEAQVVALTAEGFVATEASGSIYVTASQDVALGDLVYIAGEKVTLYGSPALAAGDVTVNGSKELVQPQPIDLASNLDPSKAGQIAYVSTEAGLLGRALNYEQEMPVSVSLLDAKGIDLDAVNMHNIRIEAYFIGLEGSEVKLAVTALEDLGINDDLKAYLYDDFSWMKPFIEASGVKVGDSIGENNASADAPNLRSNANLELLLEELLARGYEDLNPDAKVIYAQSYYWKFGKTDAHNGIRLPQLDFKGSELINVELDFDWAAHMTGSGNIDKVQIVVEVEGNGFFDNGTNVSDAFVTTQEKGNLVWQHASVLIKGVNKDTRIVIRPLNYAEASPSQQRWHLDNIKVSDSDIPYSDPVYANLTVSDEIIAFEGTPAGPETLKIKSDNAWTLTKSADSEWFTIDVTEGMAGQETEVTVTCEPSSSATLRMGTLLIASADTRKTIHVVQSAAGGELDPLIAVVGGNALTVDGLTGTFNVDVQSNVPYEVKSDVEWLSVVPAPAPLALVEVSSVTVSKQPNLTGELRTGHLVFYNEEYNLESVLTVSQELFEPVISVTPSAWIPGYGGASAFTIDSNVAYAVSTDADWITLPATEGPSGTLEVPISFDANTSDAARTAIVTFYNAEYDYTYTYTVRQSVGGYYFKDDFSWMSSAIEYYNANADTPVGDTVGSGDISANAPNAYSQKIWLATDFWDKFNEMGYENTNPSGKVMYAQDAYLKFGKTGTHSGLYLPSIAFGGEDVTLTFNWCAHVQGTGKVDPTEILVELEGAGTCADTGTQISTPTLSAQAEGVLEWQTYSVVLKGVTADTRILIRHNAMDSGKALRFHLDNIQITK